VDSNTRSTTRPGIGNAEKDVGGEEAGKLLPGSTVDTKNHLISSFSVFFQITPKFSLQLQKLQKQKLFNFSRSPTLLFGPTSNSQ
jgi:hypothetical protein